MRYGVFVLLYLNNTDEKGLEKTLDRLKSYDEIFQHFLIVDNSEANHQMIIEDIIPYAQYHSMGYNAGISNALNYAFSWAEHENLDYLLTMDQDSIYPNTEIQKMISYIESNETKDDVAIYAANYRKIYHSNTGELYTAPAISETKVKKINFAMTSGSFVNVNAVQKILPLPDYFVSYVDIDMSAKLNEAGYSILQVGSSTFDQQVGGDVKATKYNMTFHILHHTEIRYYLMTRNNCHFRSNHPKYRKQSYMRLFRILANILLGERKKLRKLKACYLGYKDYKNGILGNMPKN